MPDLECKCSECKCGQQTFSSEDLNDISLKESKSRLVDTLDWSTGIVAVGIGDKCFNVYVPTMDAAKNMPTTFEGIPITFIISDVPVAF